jgi:hypothetical protein
MSNLQSVIIIISKEECVLHSLLSLEQQRHLPKVFCGTSTVYYDLQWPNITPISRHKIGQMKASRMLEKYTVLLLGTFEFLTNACIVVSLLASRFHRALSETKRLVAGIDRTLLYTFLKQIEILNRSAAVLGA